MQRYFIDPKQFGDREVAIVGDDAHHIVRVLRSEIGDECIVSDGQEREALVRLTSLGKDRVTADIVELRPMTAEPAVEVWVAQSLPKGDKMELVIQKGTEIGASRFLPFVSDRTIVQLEPKKEGKKVERWQKIAKEAAEQAHRNRVPVVESPLSWKELLKRVEATDASWICYEKESGQELRSVIKQALHTAPKSGGPHRLLLVIGPEGGFTEQEVAAAEAAGCKSISLGRRILRTETAAMVGLTCILYEAGEMGGEA